MQITTNEEVEALMQGDSEENSIPDIKIDCKANSNNAQNGAQQCKLKLKLSDYPQLSRVTAVLKDRTTQHKLQSHLLE